jgi:hypothetical protein
LAAWTKKIKLNKEGKIIEILEQEYGYCFTIIEGPTKKYKNHPKLWDDHIYYVGITKPTSEGNYEGYLAAFPIELQKAMLDQVLKNIKFSGELAQKIKIFQEILDKYKNISGKLKNEKIEEKDSCFKGIKLTDFW